MLLPPLCGLLCSLHLLPLFFTPCSFFLLCFLSTSPTTLFAYCALSACVLSSSTLYSIFLLGSMSITLLPIVPSFSLDPPPLLSLHFGLLWSVHIFPFCCTPCYFFLLGSLSITPTSFFPSSSYYFFLLFPWLPL